MDGVIRKYNATLSSLLQYTCPNQNMNIAVNRADVAFHPTGYLANSHRFPPRSKPYDVCHLGYEPLTRCRRAPIRDGSRPEYPRYAVSRGDTSRLLPVQLWDIDRNYSKSCL